jgi:cytochrome P450
MTIKLNSMDRLPEIDPLSPEYQRDPIATIDAIRAQSPLARSGRGLEVLTYAGCAEVYNNDNFKSATPLLASMMGLDFSALKGPGRTLTNTDGNEHTTLRRVISSWFTRKRVQEMRPAVVDLVEQLIAPITARGDGKFADEVAYKIPALVFCWMMGAPTTRAQELFELSDTLLEFFEGDPNKVDTLEAANRRMKNFVEELLAAKRADPGDDLTTILLSAVDDGLIDLDDAYSLANEMLAASSDNTVNGACRVVAQLASRPADWARLRSDPSLIPGAIEECLRFDPVVETDVHVTAVATVIQDVEIPGGTIAWLNILGANYDSTVYEDPGQFDLTRRHARPQLNFGVGPHFCLGAALARMELEALLFVLTQEWEYLSLEGQPAGPPGRGSTVRPLPIAVKPN